MKPSPVQLLKLWFQKVSAEVDEKNAPSEPLSALSEPFSFEGVTLKTSVGIAEVEDNGATGRTFQVTCELVIENKKSKAIKHQRYCPYIIDIKALCVVRVPAEAVKLAPIRDLALVNGAALLWSAMREQLAALTSRMSAGQVLLPSVHFQDLRSDIQVTKAVQEPPVSVEAEQ